MPRRVRTQHRPQNDEREAGGTRKAGIQSKAEFQRRATDQHRGKAEAITARLGALEAMHPRQFVRGIQQSVAVLPWHSTVLERVQHCRARLLRIAEHDGMHSCRICLC